jgi:dTDP-glucose pyrophosphorylase
MEIIDRTRIGIVLVVNEEGKLVGTITDGDIRRFILAGNSIEESVSKVMWADPVTSFDCSSNLELIDRMKKHSVKHLPILDDQCRPYKVATLRELIFEDRAKCTAVIMAGGEGKRLRPITESIPKPMVKVGGRPIIETIIRQLVQADIENIYVSLNYMGKVIEDYFKDGSDLGVNISYLKEDKKLGTAGALTLLPEIPSIPILVINADILTKVDFSYLIDFHNEHKCVMTVGGVQFTLNIPYGVLNLAGHYLLGIDEKPQERMICNAGIYVINPEVINIVKYNVEFDMTDLIEEIIRRGLPVSTFPIYEYWIDIGQEEDLKKAQVEIREL